VASGSSQGHIAFWDLERRQLVAQHRHAHRTAVAGATFLHREPLLVTNGADNAIKVRETNDYSKALEGEKISYSLNISLTSGMDI